MTLQQQTCTSASISLCLCGVSLAVSLQPITAKPSCKQLCCTKPVAAALHHHSQVPFRQLRYTKFVTAATPVQKAALHRLQSLAESDNNLDELLEGRAALKVVKMLKQPNADSGACLQPPPPEGIISLLCGEKKQML